MALRPQVTRGLTDSHSVGIGCDITFLTPQVLSFSLRLGSLSLRSALTSICRMRSRVTPSAGPPLPMCVRAHRSAQSVARWDPLVPDRRLQRNRGHVAVVQLLLS
jgi:hypothetical protein